MTVGFHTPAAPARAVLLVFALYVLVAIFSLRPASPRSSSGFVLPSPLLLNEVHPASFPAVPPLGSKLRFGSDKGHLIGSFRVTFYWLVEEDSYPGERTVPLYALGGELLGYFTDRFVRDFRMESCALLRDGRVISSRGSGNRCEVVDAPTGVNGLTLDALRSVAVDPSLIPIGARLYIPEAVGVSLGGDKRHDGLFYVHDIGGLIRGRRIDIYLGVKSNMESFASTSLCRSGGTEVYLTH